MAHENHREIDHFPLRLRKLTQGLDVDGSVLLMDGVLFLVQKLPEGLPPFLVLFKPITWLRRPLRPNRRIGAAMPIRSRLSSLWLFGIARIAVKRQADHQ